MFCFRPIYFGGGGGGGDDVVCRECNVEIAWENKQVSSVNMTRLGQWGHWPHRMLHQITCTNSETLLESQGHRKYCDIILVDGSHCLTMVVENCF